MSRFSKSCWKSPIPQLLNLQSPWKMCFTDFELTKPPAIRVLVNKITDYFTFSAVIKKSIEDDTNSVNI